MSARLLAVLLSVAGAAASAAPLGTASAAAGAVEAGGRASAAPLGTASAAAGAPKLVLVVSVGQMQAEHLERFAPKLTGGFKTLLQGGAVFTEAHHRHVPTQSAPGHAALMTGRMPGRNGIVADRWWDRSNGRAVRAFDDSVNGVGPEQLLSYALGDVLKARSPASIVVAASVDPGAAVMLGGKRADAAFWFDEAGESFVSSSYYGARPAWLAGFNEGLKDKGALLGGRRLGTPIGRLLASPAADRLLADLVGRILIEYPLGRDDATDILAVSFSGTDRVGREYGPDSRQMEEQLLKLDAVLGELLGALAPDGLVVLLTAGHGAMPVPESREGKALGLRRASPGKFRAAIETALHGIYPAAPGQWVERLELPHLYLNRALAESRGFDWRTFLKDASKSIIALEGVAEVYTADKLTSPTDEIRTSTAVCTPAYRASYHPARSGDLLIRPKEDFLFDDDGTGSGTPYRYDTHVPLVFWGAGVKAGRFPSPARVTDAAPTLAVLMGVEFPPDKAGRVLVEMLE